MSKILRLESENVKRISVVEITPEGELVIIGGHNGAGKSSVIDSIEWALGGKAAIEDMPIRRGETHARTIIETTDYIVQRTYTLQEDGSFNTYLKVTTTEGGTLTNPQQVLDGLIGNLSFDPLAFVGLKPKEQRVSLVKLAGLDFGRLDAARTEAQEHRRVTRAEIKQLEGELAGIPVDPDAPEQPVKIAELMDELNRRQQINRDRIKKQSILSQAQELVKRRERELREAKENLAAATAVLTTYEASELPEEADEQEIGSQIAKADEVNGKVRSNQRAKEICGYITKKNDSVDLSNQRLEQIEADVANAIKGAHFPIDGLAVGDAGITIGGVPFEQCSTAEQIKLSVGIGIAMNPGLRVLLVRQGSLLDENSLELVRTIAAEHDAQVWMERVSTGDEVSVIIEDGHVKGVEPVTEAENVGSAPTGE